MVPGNPGHRLTVGHLAECEAGAMDGSRSGSFTQASVPDSYERFMQQVRARLASKLGDRADSVTVRTASNIARGTK